MEKKVTGESWGLWAPAQHKERSPHATGKQVPPLIGCTERTSTEAPLGKGAGERALPQEPALGAVERPPHVPRGKTLKQARLTEGDRNQDWGQLGG